MNTITRSLILCLALLGLPAHAAEESDRLTLVEVMALSGKDAPTFEATVEAAADSYIICSAMYSIMAHLAEGTDNPEQAAEAKQHVQVFLGVPFMVYGAIPATIRLTDTITQLMERYDGPMKVMDEYGPTCKEMTP